MAWTAVVYALLGGIVPALLWLWFFLREDALHPEPRRYVLLAFLLGIVAIVVTLPLQYFTQCAQPHILPSFMYYGCNIDISAPVYLWAFFEEIVKWSVVAACILWRTRVADEPIDEMVYLITIALGFAAFETALFLFEPLARNAFMESVMTANLRFIGAALVHTFASGIVGFFLAITFYTSWYKKILGLCTGIIVAGVLHGMFNHHILKVAGQDATVVFFSVWMGVIVLFLLFERAKRVRRR
jgi:protease PrsW